MQCNNTSLQSDDVRMRSEIRDIGFKALRFFQSGCIECKVK